MVIPRIDIKDKSELHELCLSLECPSYFENLAWLGLKLPNTFKKLLKLVQLPESVLKAFRAFSNLTSILIVLIIIIIIIIILTLYNNQYYFINYTFVIILLLL